MPRSSKPWRLHRTSLRRPEESGGSRGWGGHHGLDIRSAQVRFGDLGVRLMDDSKEDTEDAEVPSLMGHSLKARRTLETKQVLRLFVHSTELTATVATGLDYRGKSSANLKIAGREWGGFLCSAAVHDSHRETGRLGGVEATHMKQDVIKQLDMTFSSSVALSVSNPSCLCLLC